jgi:hypothetical protein
MPPPSKKRLDELNRLLDQLSKADLKKKPKKGGFESDFARGFRNAAGLAGLSGIQLGERVTGLVLGNAMLGYHAARDIGDVVLPATTSDPHSILYRKVHPGLSPLHPAAQRALGMGPQKKEEPFKRLRGDIKSQIHLYGQEIHDPVHNLGNIGFDIGTMVLPPAAKVGIGIRALRAARAHGIEDPTGIPRNIPLVPESEKAAAKALSAAGPRANR